MLIGLIWLMTGHGVSQLTL